MANTPHSSWNLSNMAVGMTGSCFLERPFVNRSQIVDSHRDQACHRALPIRNPLFMVTPTRGASTLCRAAISATASGSLSKPECATGLHGTAANSALRSESKFERRAHPVQAAFGERDRQTAIAHIVRDSARPAATISRMASCTRFS